MTLLKEDGGEPRPAASDSASTEFDRTTRLVPDPSGEPGHFEVELDEGWTSLVGVHGGYLAALAVRGAEAMVPGRPVRTLTTSFLRSGRTGPAILSVETIRSGRSVTTLLAELTQEDRLLTTTRLTLVAEVQGLEWGVPGPTSLAAPDECVAIEAPPGVVHFGQAEARLDPSSLPFTGGERARVGGYIRPLENGPVDAAWLAMAVDWFPPPAFVRVAPPTGGVSIDLTTHIHRVGPGRAGDEWLAASFTIDTSTGGVAVEHGWIGEPGGSLMAESFQTRWTASR